LQRDPKKRLGSNGGFSEIGQHKFFDGLNFEDLLAKKIKADFVPNISGKLDIHNFDEEFTSENIEMTPCTDTTLNMLKKNQNQFKDFD